MAEFTKVMYDWKRFCKSHEHCGKCSFDGMGICSDGHLSEVPFDKIEQMISDWAEKHPEPVYPTWGMWLMGLGLVEVDYCEITMDMPYDWGTEYRAINRKLKEHIPADIAQKLGIKPIK